MTLFLVTSYANPGYLRHSLYITELRTYYANTEPSIQLNLSSFESESEEIHPRELENEDSGSIDPEMLMIAISTIDSNEDTKRTNNGGLNRAKNCVICSIEQPLRSKHCLDCQSCVPLYYYHCPCLGICIGERNRKIYWAFLFFQSMLLWAVLYFLYTNLHSKVKGIDYVKKYLPQIISFIVSAFFCLMTTVLLVFQSFLAAANLTAREFLSWEKIHYFKKWPRKYRSPFSNGFIANLKFYFFNKSNRDAHQWYLPVNYHS